MKTNLIKAFGIWALIGLAVTAASAQFTITIPKLPGIKKSAPKATQPSTTPSETSRPTPQSSKNEPTQAKKADCSSGALGYHVEGIKKTQTEAESFRPGLRGYYVSELNDRKNDYLESALLASSRKEWFKNDTPDSATGKCLNAAFDELAAVARKTLPGYTGPSDYTFGTPAEKKALTLGSASDIAEAKILKVGMKQANWMIAKDDYNLPTARYKHGVVWAQYPGREFCWIFWVNLKQDYAGGGTYGASYGQYVGRSMAGCPAGK